jgi:hypothetical protein
MSSPAQIRAQAARAFRQHQRTAPVHANQLQAILLQRLAAMAPPGVRMPAPGETPLSPHEIQHAVYHGLIAGRASC